MRADRRPNRRCNRGKTQRGVRLAKFRLEPYRGPAGGYRRLEQLLLPAQSVPGEQRPRVGKAGPGPGEGAVPGNGGLQIFDRETYGIRRAAGPVVTGAQIQVVGERIVGRPVCRLVPGAFRELQRQLLDDLPRDRVLHFEDICRRAIETLSPDLAFIRGVDEVHLHDEAVASLHHLAGQQEARAQLAAKRLRIQVGPFVAEDGASRHHAKSIDASQVIDEALGDSVTQVSASAPPALPNGMTAIESTAASAGWGWSVLRNATARSRPD